MGRELGFVFKSYRKLFAPYTVRMKSILSSQTVVDIPENVDITLMGAQSL